MGRRECRLKSAGPRLAAEGAKKAVFAYDYMGRRVRKTVSTYTSGAWIEEADGDSFFVYDGWNVVMVLDANAGSATLRKYTWGLDLSDSIQGAGGVGGLLAVEETSGANQGAYWYLYDGSGNVGQILDATDHDPASDMRIVAHYEYDPFGNAIVVDNDRRYLDGSLQTADAGYANSNPFRFSTKWFDEETHLCYYGYRYYIARLGRWLNRDPIGEDGGANLYGFVLNDPTHTVDKLGLVSFDFDLGLTAYYGIGGGAGGSVEFKTKDCCKDGKLIKGGIKEVTVTLDAEVGLGIGGEVRLAGTKIALQWKGPGFQVSARANASTDCGGSLPKVCACADFSISTNNTFDIGVGFVSATVNATVTGTYTGCACYVSGSGMCSEHKFCGDVKVGGKVTVKVISFKHDWPLPVVDKSGCRTVFSDCPQ